MNNSNVPLGQITRLTNWSYADITARDADTDIAATDVGKCCRVLSPESIYELTNHSPITWRNIADGGTPGNIDTDVALTADSDALIPSQKAVKAYIDALLAANDAMIFKGVIDCSTNPNYPAADAGHVYSISVAGKIGGASGVNVEIADSVLCIADSTASGDQATVGAYWVIRQANIDGAVTGPASVTDGAIVKFSGTSGKILAELAAASQAEMEAGTETALRGMSPLRVAQAIAALAAGGGSGVVETIVPGTGISVDDTDPANPIVSATGGGGGSLTLERWTALEGHPPSSAYAVPFTSGALAVLGFNDTSDYSMYFVSRIPAGAVLTNGISVFIDIRFDTATSGSAIFESSFEKGDDLGSLSFGTVKFASGAANASLGKKTTIQIDHSSSEIDGLAVGDIVILKISRDADGTNGTDDATGDAQLLTVEIRGRA